MRESLLAEVPAWSFHPKLSPLSERKEMAHDLRFLAICPRFERLSGNAGKKMRSRAVHFHSLRRLSYAATSSAADDPEKTE
jgi:hypothetical protein